SIATTERECSGSTRRSPTSTCASARSSDSAITARSWCSRCRRSRRPARPRWPPSSLASRTTRWPSSSPGTPTASPASLPRNGVDESLRELDRATSELGALGGQLFTNVGGVPLDDPRFEPLLARFETLGRAIWLHPTRNANWSDYPTESTSDYGLWWSLGWPYETAAALSRLVYSGALE